MSDSSMDYSVRRGVLAYQIEDRLDDIPEELRFMLSSCFLAFMRACKTFGKDSEPTKGALSALKEILKIYRYEKKLLKYILKNISMYLMNYLY